MLNKKFNRALASGEALGVTGSILVSAA